LRSTVALNSNLQSWTKVLTHLSKTNAFYRRPSVIQKASFLLIAKLPSPPFQCCNRFRGHYHLVTTLKRREGDEMSKLDTENSLIEPNGSFSESVSTTFVDDCRLFHALPKKFCFTYKNLSNFTPKMFQILSVLRRRSQFEKAATTGHFGSL